MDFQTLKLRALGIQKQYNELNAKKWKAWGLREYTEGLVGDVGDLMKLVQAKEGFRDKGDHDAKLRHELADCLWALIVIAEHLGVDLETTFMKEMDAMEARVRAGKG